MATRRLCVVGVWVGVLSAFLSPAFAQVAGGRGGAPAVLIDKLSITEIRTPDFNTKSHPSVKNTETWLQLLVDFKVEAAEEKWLDELTFDWYVLLMNGETPRLLLSRSVAYADIEVGETERAVVYVHPRTLRRYYSERGRSVSDRNVLVYLDVKMRNVKVGEFVFPKAAVAGVPPRWWENPNVNRVENGLLGREQTPFAPLDGDFYPPLKDTGRR